MNVSGTGNEVQVLPEGNSNSYWFLGVCLAVLGTLAGTIGKQMVRCSKLAKERRKQKEGNFLLIAGLALQVALNPACDVAGYALAPASVIAPVTGMDIVWNTLIAPCSLGETLTPRRLFSAAIIFFTATTSVFFRQINDVNWSAEYVQHVLLQSRTMVYGLCFTGWFLFNTLVLMKYPSGSAVRGFSLGATAGTLAGNMWCTKIVAVLLEQCFGGNCLAWTKPVSWFATTAAILFSTTNLYFISLGLQHYEALFMVTVFMGSNIVTNSLSAIVVLAEMDEAPWWKLGGYVLCILGMMAGLVLLTEGEKESPGNHSRFAPASLEEVELSSFDVRSFGAPSSPLD
mmetsp:Transcript_22523/g.53647  ORF Transcript_22523/g.53647 Transcript_22523/m.53647 type:complete len:343 (-) Transcript_22523:91-1119(-)|eukprot:CAMPEP_0181447930 /NCGR_PEP_ID=MMETSP1110-20121109/26877_1 /TAXON_ID=174948 /ORGANISM="Symbiodinium sp., Strain CCMP421" /LENGTH=342 /DNA_ID=CAMNT_0023572061 /DNA_START=1 /DNA_END=1029 /DNA_ORIENTATION=+